MQDVRVAVRRFARITVGIAAIVGVAIPRHVVADGDQAPHVSGSWTIDREHSEFPPDIGFDMPVAGVAEGTPTAAGRSGRGGSRGTSPSSGSTGLTLAHETEQTLKIAADVTDEAAHPWETLVIAVTDAEVMIGDGANVTRHFHPGKVDEQRLTDGGITTHAKWDKATFIVDYEVEKDRNVRYTYTCATGDSPLTVTVSFRDHGHGEVVTREYKKRTFGVIFTPGPFSG